jgi:hypothetical protein
MIVSRDDIKMNFEKSESDRWMRKIYSSERNSSISEIRQLL